MRYYNIIESEINAVSFGRIRVAFPASYHKTVHHESVFPPGMALFFVSFGLFFRFFSIFFDQGLFQIAQKMPEKPGNMENLVAKYAVFARKIAI